MLTVRRDRHDIAMDILRKATTKKKKTELISDVGLSYLQTKQYLDMLVGKGLLEVDETHHFKTTRKGLDFLEKCHDCLLLSWDKQKRKSTA